MYYIYLQPQLRQLCVTQQCSTKGTAAGWMKVAQTQNNVSLRTLKFQTWHVFPTEGRSPLVNLTLRAFNDDFSPCKTCIINYMQEKEVLYFNQLLIESETPQRSVCHHLDVTWYILVPEVRIITLCKLHVHCRLSYHS